MPCSVRSAIQSDRLYIKRIMKLLCMINREAWAVGTLARLFKLHAPTGWQIEIRSHRDIDHNPQALRRAVAESDVVHWAAHKSFSHYVHHCMPSGEKTAHVVTMHHFEGDEENLDYLYKTRGIAVHAEKYLLECRERLGDKIQVTYIPYPVGDMFFREGVHRLENKVIRENGKSFRIGFFSSAQYETGRKGVDLIPALARELTERLGRWELVVSGLGWDEVMARPEFRELPIKHVVYPSYFDMPKAYSSLDAYLCLSRIEGGPMTVFEAAACGAPVVSTPVGRVPDTLDTDMYKQIPFDDPNAVADAMAEIQEGDESVYNMRVRAMERVRATMSSQVYSEELLKFYAAAVGKEQNEFGPVLSESWRARNLVRRWRAWDRTYWAKELWMTGQRKIPLIYLLEAVLLDPFSEGLWRVPLRKLGFRKDEC